MIWFTITKFWSHLPKFATLFVDATHTADISDDKVTNRALCSAESEIFHRIPAPLPPMGTGHNATSRNGDNKNDDTSKRRHSKTETTVVKRATTRVKTATTISQNGDKHWSKRRQPLVKMATKIGQNGDNHIGQNGDNRWSKRRQ